MKPYKNLIFDIGNVLIDIDVRVTIREFEKLAAVDFAEIISHSKQHHIFDLFETGKISDQQFRNELKKFLKPGVTDDEINTAWNSILISYPEQKFQLLKVLKARYKTFALSNTNEIHISTFNAVVKTLFGVNEFSDFFHHAYYSNELGYRKPDKKIYEFVLQKENLNADETFFVDDNPENVEAAKNLGIHAYFLQERNELHKLLQDLKII